MQVIDFIRHSQKLGWGGVKTRELFEWITVYWVHKPGLAVRGGGVSKCDTCHGGQVYLLGGVMLHT